MNSTERIIAKAERSFPAPRGYTGRIIVSAQLYSYAGQKPHFSVTCAIGTAKELRTGDWQAGGCCHDEAAKAWPAIAPIIALHLSDEEGVPMHALENGFYWCAKPAGIEMTYGPDQSPEECLQILAKHLRVDAETAKAIVNAVRDVFVLNQNTSEARARFAEIVEAQLPRWKAEADAGLELIRSFSNEAVAA